MLLFFIKLRKTDFSVSLTGNVQNMEPVQNCAGFIFYMFQVVVHF